MVLDALRQLDEETELSGLVEADETYFRFSEKGDKNLTRAPRERGSKAPLSGKSRHHVCVLTTQDRTGQRFAKVIDRGVPKHRNVAEGLELALSVDVRRGVSPASGGPVRGRPRRSGPSPGRRAPPARAGRRGPERRDGRRTAPSC